VGGQINDVVTRLREIAAETGAAQGAGADGGTRLRVAMQLWFDTPAFLVDMFKKVNPGVELVSSDPIMDPLRGVKEPAEVAAMTEAQRVAGIGMDRARSLLRDGADAHEVATEAMYAMMRAGATRTSTPVYVNVGRETCMLHGWQSPQPMRTGDLVVIDLTPMVEGYCANLARTFVLGEPDARQQTLLDAYEALIPAARDAMRPGSTVARMDAAVKAVLKERDLAQYQVNGIGHGLGLRFEETPASTIIPPHRNVPLREGMTVTIGHTILAIPGFGGVRHEDVYRVTPEGGEILLPYPIDPVVAA
jgi:Xaa-Pro aminopeptidase